MTCFKVRAILFAFVLQCFLQPGIIRADTLDFSDADIGDKEKLAYTTIRILSTTMVVAISVYMIHHKMTLTPENFIQATTDIWTNPESGRFFRSLCVPGIVAGVQSGMIVRHYPKFREFIANPKIFYFALRSYMERNGWDVESKRNKTLLLVAKEAESFKLSLIHI